MARKILFSLAAGCASIENTPDNESMTLQELRENFPHTGASVYLNHAAMGPLSSPVKTAIEAFLAERHQSNVENWVDFMPVLDETRGRLARLIGASPERVEFMPNTSYGLNVLASGLDWRPGDRIVVPACEFPANVYPFLNLARRWTSSRITTARFPWTTSRRR